MYDAVKTAVQLQFDRLKDEAQAKNADFINKLDDNIKKIIKDQVKQQVKAQVSKIMPKIKKTVNKQLKAEVLTHLSNESKTSYAVVTGGSAKDQPNVNSNFRTLVADPVFSGVNISIPRKVVEKAKHGLKRIVMNSKGLFFFNFDSRAGLEAVLEGGPWFIRKSLIILKKWSMDTRLLKEELTLIPIWVKLHDVPIQVFE
ncbi:zinc knuckle CX2CX4HX4C containing protein [Tanacetum coccineum]